MGGRGVRLGGEGGRETRRSGPRPGSADPGGRGPGHAPSLEERRPGRADPAPDPGGARPRQPAPAAEAAPGGGPGGEAASRLGSSRAHVANTFRLLSLPADVQRLLGDGRIQAGHARALLARNDDGARWMLALRIAAENLSVRQVEDLVRRYS